ncbi:MAG: hypothetical protein Q9195_000030 [Heterodermia aff. obscurata]
MPPDLNSTVQDDQHCNNSFTSSNVTTLAQQNNNTETRDMDSFSLRFDGTSPRNQQISGFQNTGGFPVDQSNLYDLSQVRLESVFDKGAAQASTQAPNLPRGSGSISNPPFQENGAVGLTSNGRITPLVNQGQDGNIQGAHQASATVPDQPVTSVQNPQPSQDASTPRLLPKNPSCDRITAYIRMLSKKKMDAEQQAKTMLTENQQLRANNQQMWMRNQHMQIQIQNQNELTKHMERDHQGLMMRNNALENALRMLTDEHNRLRGEFVNQSHHNRMVASHRLPLTKEVIKARLGPVHITPGANANGPTAQHSLSDQSNFNPVSATTSVTPTVVSSQNGLFNHQNGQQATTAPHNPLLYLHSPYSGRAYQSPPNTGTHQIITFPNVSNFTEAKPQAETIDLTLDEPEKNAPMIQIAANTTGTNEVPAFNGNPRAHSVSNNIPETLRGPTKEPAWMHQERENMRKQEQDRAFNLEKARKEAEKAQKEAEKAQKEAQKEALKKAQKELKSKRKAEVREGPDKTANGRQAANTTEPVQGKPPKRLKVSGKSKASATAKQDIAQRTAEKQEKFAAGWAEEMARFNAEDEKEAREREEQEREQYAAELATSLDAFNAEDEQEPQEFEAGIEAEPEASAKDNVNAEFNQNQPDAFINPALLVLNHHPKGQSEVTADRPSSPMDPLFDDDGSLTDAILNGLDG